LVDRLGSEYAQQFPPETIAQHVAAMKKLSAQKPVAVLLDEQSDGLIDCTIVAFDHPFEFSCITGLMAATGFSIQSSVAFTLPRVGGPTSVREMFKQEKKAIRRRDPMSDALILDHFRGKLVGPIEDFKTWAKQFEPAVVEVIRLLDEQNSEATERAKRLVNERVTQWLKTRRGADSRGSDLAPIEVTIDQLPQATRLRLRAPDAPAFLYALSTALSLHGLQIERTSVQTLDGHAVDEIDLVDSRGKPIADPQRVQRLRLSVLLTQRFAYFLDRAPDPFTALARFEELSERIAQMPEQEQWLSVLADPRSMEDLAKVLGASDYLWEDFIRSHADALLPAIRQHIRGREICPSSRTLPRRLDEALHGAKDLEELRVRLNQFKDRELFLIDLDHILSSEHLDATFQILSERLVLLAENLVSAAAQFVYSELVRKHGTPDNPGFALFGLGKLGGVALGYASDIELLFLFDSEGKTTGGSGGSIANSEFFARLTRETSDSIKAKGEGIFRVDLRLRPYGKGGPLASSREQFVDYYRPEGKAHPFERLALVRLRWIAGDATLGFAIEQLRDQFVYEGPPLDLDAIWEVSGKMRAQHLLGQQLNSKYSPGGLADLEATVQLLQVMHARQAPQLRTPRLDESIQSLRRAGILSPIEFEELMGAYQFLRRLINAQRVLRGSAQDLFLPARSSDELLHLARRMNYLPEENNNDVGSLLLKDLQRHTDAVKKFVRKRFNRACPGR
jgi:glutamate-ammonia-ligase adenylyltransferase